MFERPLHFLPSQPHTTNVFLQSNPFWNTKEFLRHFARGLFATMSTVSNTDRCIHSQKTIYLVTYLRVLEWTSHTPCMGRSSSKLISLQVSFSSTPVHHAYRNSCAPKETCTSPHSIFLRFTHHDIPFARFLSTGQPDEFLRLIVQCLTPIVFAPGESIITEGSFGNEMYFVVKGEVVIYNEKKMQKIRTLRSVSRCYSSLNLGFQLCCLIRICSNGKESVTILWYFYLYAFSTSKLTIQNSHLGSKIQGTPFGEAALLRPTKRAYSAKAVSHVDMYTLSREDVEDILFEYPEIAESFQAYAKKHESEMRRKSCGSNTDENAKTLMAFTLEEGDMEESSNSDEDSDDSNNMPMYQRGNNLSKLRSKKIAEERERGSTPRLHTRRSGDSTRSRSASRHYPTPPEGRSLNGSGPLRGSNRLRSVSSAAHIARRPSQNIARTSIIDRTRSPVQSGGRGSDQSDTAQSPKTITSPLFRSYHAKRPSQVSPF